MPLLKIETNAPVSEDKLQTLLPALSKLVAETIRKPESYVMVTLSSAAMLMAGTPGNAAFADVRSIGGLDDDVNRRMSQKICGLLSQELGIPVNRTYLNFTDVPPGNWGWNSETFG
jgi:phenylpyruvate tautomerase